MISEALLTALHEDLDRRAKERKNEVVTSLMGWLTAEARLKPVPDLDKRLALMQRRLERLSERLKIRVKDGKVQAEVHGEDEDTLKMFRLGTSWFEGHPDVIEQVLAGLFEQP